MFNEQQVVFEVKLVFTDMPETIDFMVFKENGELNLVVNKGIPTDSELNTNIKETLERYY